MLEGVLSEDPIGSVEWEEVEASAKLAFSVWVGQPELAWAKKEWEAIAELGLADYGDEFDRHKIVFRFLVLAGIYHDFCDAAWGVLSEPTYGEWAQPLDLNPFIIGQLYARRRNWIRDDEVAVGEAVGTLAESQRSTVASALLQILGTTSGLYASLWNSKNESPAEDKENNSECDEDETFDDDESQMSAYSWVDGGCHRYR